MLDPYMKSKTFLIEDYFLSKAFFHGEREVISLIRELDGELIILNFKK